ncbi:MAG: DUF5596 domain-containing protein, partial [Lachnospiraceae bacterium]|nr:DUF5596 domain-containing protein [Lachnospiraceae bacterium]
MNIENLCNLIQLDPQLKARVLGFADDFDFTVVDMYLKEFRIYEKMSEALEKLMETLREDPDRIKILACMLKASADIYETYKERGIGDEIYVATMKCYPRFVEETFEMTGKRYFDRFWWTTRQAGGHLFRIDELEYEIAYVGGTVAIDMHIPSDADFSPNAVDRSLDSAKQFFATHYPELADAEYRCNSWLLDPQMQNMLGEGSNILSFQHRFEIFDEGKEGTDFLQWLFKTNLT